jgi:hypothetical protein
VKKIALSVLLLISAFSVIAQKKKEKELQQQVDTLTKSNQALSKENESLKSSSTKTDSLSKELDKYTGLYAVLKDELVKKDFNPADMKSIIDSIKAGHDSALARVPVPIVNNDSLKYCTAVNDSMRLMNDSLRKETVGLTYAVNLLKGGSGSGPGDPKDFSGVWKLLFRKVKIVGESPREGIVDISSEPVSKTANLLSSHLITSINFVDHEFAEIAFEDGQKTKCMYEIVKFDKAKPYHIDFKGTKADIRMYFMNTVGGTRVSFKTPEVANTYYFGQITR